MLNLTQVPAPRVPLVDGRTGLVSTEWFRFFNGLYAIVGENQNTIQPVNGGTGLSTIPTNGQLLIGNAVGYTLNTLTPGAGIGVTNAAGSITLANTGVLSWSGGATGLTPATPTTGNVTLSGLLNVASGGTGQSSYTNGQLLIGNTTGNTLGKATLTAGSGIAITNGAAAITIASDKAYGSFYDTTTQTATVINTATAITFNNTDLSNGVYIGLPTSRIIVDSEGIYNFGTSFQLDKTAGGTAVFDFWFRVNGVDVANSASRIRIQGNNAEIFSSLIYFFDLNANDYVELMFSVTDLSVEVAAFPAAAPHPGIPSMILTVQQV
jgi:hypothetical protein